MYDVPLIIPSSVSADAADLIVRLLTRRPENRLGASFGDFKVLMVRIPTVCSVCLCVCGGGGEGKGRPKCVCPTLGGAIHGLTAPCPWAGHAGRCHAQGRGPGPLEPQRSLHAYSLPAWAACPAPCLPHMCLLPLLLLLLLISVSLPFSSSPPPPLLPHNSQRHPWFKAIDWDLLVLKKVAAPWRPTTHAFAKVVTTTGHRSPALPKDPKLEVSSGEFGVGGGGRRPRPRVRV